jgi:hypothetical protein
MVADYFVNFKNKCPRIRSEEFVTPDDIVNCDPASSPFDISPPRTKCQGRPDLHIGQQSGPSDYSPCDETHLRTALPSLDERMIS